MVLSLVLGVLGARPGVITARYWAMIHHRYLVHIAPIILSHLGTIIRLITVITSHLCVKSMMQKATLVNLRVVDSPH